MESAYVGCDMPVGEGRSDLGDDNREACVRAAVEDGEASALKLEYEAQLVREVVCAPAVAVTSQHARASAQLGEVGRGMGHEVNAGRDGVNLNFKGNLCSLLEGVRANVMAEPTVGVQIPGPSWASDVLELSDADRADIAKQAAAFLAFMEG